jgi:hypothetical protein
MTLVLIGGYATRNYPDEATTEELSKYLKLTVLEFMLNLP